MRKRNLKIERGFQTSHKNLQKEGKNQDVERGRGREEKTCFGQTRSYIFHKRSGLKSLNL